MSDLVKKLKNTRCTCDIAKVFCRMADDIEAAQEIERLTAEVSKWRSLFSGRMYACSGRDCIGIYSEWDCASQRRCDYCEAVRSIVVPDSTLQSREMIDRDDSHQWKLMRAWEPDRNHTVRIFECDKCGRKEKESRRTIPGGNDIVHTHVYPDDAVWAQGIHEPISPSEDWLIHFHN